MKKTLRKVAALALMIMLAFAAAAVSVSAAGSDGSGGYSHKIRISAGNKGTISDYDKNGDVISVDGDKVLVDGTETDFALNSDAADKYYVRGLKVTGEDNDLCFQSISKTQKDRDLSVVVVYGLKGAMVRYTVNYVDESGSDLAASEEYYGMPGDKPVVSYKYIDGYLPNAYTEGKTLSENEADNVFTFTYYDATAEDTVVEVNGGAGAGANNAAGNGAGAGAGAGTADGADGTAIGDNATPLAGPQEYADLDDNATPKAESAEAEKRGISPLGAAAIALGAAAIAAGVYVAVRRRREYEYEDEEQDTA